MGQILTCRYSINVYNTYTNKTKCKPYYNTKGKITAFWHPTLIILEDSDNVSENWSSSISELAFEQWDFIYGNKTYAHMCMYLGQCYIILHCAIFQIYATLLL